MASQQIIDMITMRVPFTHYHILHLMVHMSRPAYMMKNLKRGALPPNNEDSITVTIMADRSSTRT